MITSWDPWQERLDEIVVPLGMGGPLNNQPQKKKPYIVASFYWVFSGYTGNAVDGSEIW